MYILELSPAVSNKQVAAGRYAHLEHPQRAKSWHTPALQVLRATHWVDLDQCEFGLSVDGAGLNNKPTRRATNKPAECKLSRRCKGDHVHTRLLGGSRSHDAAKLTRGNCKGDCRSDGSAAGF